MRILKKIITQNLALKIYSIYQEIKMRVRIEDICLHFLKNEQCKRKSSIFEFCFSLVSLFNYISTPYGLLNVKI